MLRWENEKWRSSLPASRQSLICRKLSPAQASMITVIIITIVSIISIIFLFPGKFYFRGGHLFASRATYCYPRACPHNSLDATTMPHSMPIVDLGNRV